MTFVKFRRSCLFEGQVLFGGGLAPFRASLDADDVGEFKKAWRNVRRSFAYDSLAVSGKYWDAFEDLLADGISEIQHLGADQDELLPCVGKPTVSEIRPNDWLIDGGIDGDVLAAAWRVTHFPKGFYTYRLPFDLPELDLHDIELRPGRRSR